MVHVDSCRLAANTEESVGSTSVTIERESVQIKPENGSKQGLLDCETRAVHVVKLHCRPLISHDDRIIESAYL